MMYRIALGEEKVIVVKAKEKYSSEGILVNSGEKYQINCDQNQYWTDLFIKSCPDGYTNRMADLIGQRVPGVLCFCLCGVYNGQKGGFPIGSSKEVIVQEDGELQFFANDTPGFYWNNFGQLCIIIKRVL